MRFFIALELDTTIKDHLIDLISPVRSAFPEVSWISSEQLFIVNRFLGNPDRKVRRQLESLLGRIGSQVAPFQATLSGLGCFPTTDPVRTLWVGVKESTGMLARFERDCEAECKKIGLRSEEKRTEFIPHIVLGRVSGKVPVGPLRRRFCGLRLQELPIHCSQVSLVLSKLTKSGPNYEILHRAPFSARIAT